MWFAYQNEDGSTTRLLPDNEGTFRFTASNRLVIGMVFQDGSDYHTEIFQATSDELKAVSSSACLEEVGTRTVNGNVTGLGAGQVAAVSMNFAAVPLQSGNTSFSLTALPDRPLDVVASRQAVTASSRIADRVVIRRTQTFVNNATMPVIDFAGAEAITTLQPSAALSGIFAGDAAYLQNNFFSQLETSHSLSYVENISNGNVPFAAVPATSVAVGDYHELILLAVNADGSVRGMENFFGATGPQALALGPPLSEPMVTALPGSATNLRLRLRLPTQQSYDNAVAVTFRQQDGFTVKTVTLWSTIGFMRTVVGNWTLDIPSLTGVAGWNEAWGLEQGLPVDWTVTAYGGRSELVFGAKPAQDEFIRYALRHSDPGTVAVRFSEHLSRFARSRR